MLQINWFLAVYSDRVISFLGKAAHKLYIQGVAGFSLAPVTQAPYIVAAYVEGKKVMELKLEITCLK